ncbi:homoserine dehydrogenase [Tenuifilum thalassicum]|uniref:Homoserine dehydrogenase n=1 Tax=Tenuifilum thalassicum TaxID=2590900 RepID=A0A7D3XDE2_9BACT|nr:homoserine dehydrogenase [Tenuifilum thalassicum]QKG79027.1 homoserine dehydrogenase [Tenuifilum thalassicum]
METLTIKHKGRILKDNNVNQQVIGLFGLGNVGHALYKVISEVPKNKAYIKQVCVKQRNKTRYVPPEIITYNHNDIINDPEINLVVELIDNANEAYDIVKGALLKGKSVVSGNKTMLAHHLPELIAIQHETGAALLYDASACGSIPIIRNLEEYYDNDLLKSIKGILNGSSNYILTQIFNCGEDYSSALKKAQELGFAESNPDFDVLGFDALYKLVILAVHGFGTYVNPSNAFCYGISNISNHDVQFAREKGKKIKLVAQLQKLNHKHFTLFVIPTLIDPTDYIFNVDDEFNGVIIEGEYYDKQFLFGKGAGGFPTGSAVLSDITARFHNYRYEYKKQNYFTPPEYSTDVELELYIRYHKLTDVTILGKRKISEQYVANDYRWEIAWIKLSDLIRVKELLPKLNIFIASTGKFKFEPNEENGTKGKENDSEYVPIIDAF